MIRFGYIEQIYANCADDIRHLFSLVRPTIGSDGLVDSSKVMERVTELMEEDGHIDILDKPRVSLATYLNTFYWEIALVRDEDEELVLKYVWERSYRLRKGLAVALALEKFNFKSFTDKEPGVDDLPSYFAGLRNLLELSKLFDKKFRTSHREQVKRFPEFELFHGNRGFAGAAED